MARSKILTISRLVVALGINNATTLAGTALLAYMVTPAEYSDYVFKYSLVMTILPVLEFGLNTSTARFHNARIGESNKYILAGRKTRLLLYSFLSLVLLSVYFINRPVSTFPDIDSYVFSASVALALSIWTWKLSELQAQRLEHKYANSLMVNGVIRLSVTAFLFYFVRPSSDLLIISLYVAPSLLMTLALWRSIFCEAKEFKVPLRQESAALLRYGAWVYAANMLYPLVFTLPPILLTSAGREKDTALFGLGVALIATLNPIRNALKIYLIPRASALVSRNEIEEFYSVSKWKIISIVFFALFLVMAYWCAHELLFRSKYGSALPVILLFVGFLSAAIIGLFNTAVHASGKVYKVLIVNGLRAGFVFIVCVYYLADLSIVWLTALIGVSQVLGELLLMWYIRKPELAR